MAEYQALEELLLTESEDAALAIVRDDLRECSDYKRDNWPAETLKARWAAYHGDPAIFDWSRVQNAPGIRPVHNLTFIQIRHKVGKLTRPPTRLNTYTRTSDPTPQIRFALNAAKKRLEQKAKEANWRGARRTLARDAAVQGLGIRAIGVEYSGVRPKLRSWRVRGPEWYFDPCAEPHDLLGTASWVAWRRYVGSDKLIDTLRKFDVPAGAGGGDLDAEGDSGITLPDDEILLRGDMIQSRTWLPYGRVLVTDYYRKDQTMDLYYPCSKCGRQATVGRYITARTVRPLLECQHCQNMEKRMPDRESFRQGMRYPFGRHIRILGSGTVVYNGPCKMDLEDVYPFVCMPWFEDETPKGMSEVEVQHSAQSTHSLALAMTSDNAIYNAHPKRWIRTGGITKPDNNDPGNIMEVSEEAAAEGGVHVMPAGNIGESAKILLSESKDSSYELGGNDRVAHGGEPTTVRSGVGIGRIVAASEVSLYSNQDIFYEAETRFYRIVRDIMRKVDYPQEMFVRNDSTGMDQSIMYDRMLMNLIADLEVTTEQQVDQEREELYSRAVELKGLGDPFIDWEMLHELSGIPPDILMRAMQRVSQSPPGTRAIDAILPGAGGGPPPLSVIPGGRTAAPALGQGADAMGAGRVRQESAGRHAPPQHRPPSRSRGMQTPASPLGGGGP